MFTYPIFLSGTLEGVRKSVIAASEHALNNINILNHDGGHPRKGAVDLIPIHKSTLNICVKIALQIKKICYFELVLCRKILSAQMYYYSSLIIDCSKHTSVWL